MPPMSAASWYTSSTPFTARRQTASSLKSATINSSAGLGSNSGFLASTPRTQSPPFFRCFTRWCPMKPPAPVTSARFSVFFANKHLPASSRGDSPQRVEGNPDEDRDYADNSEEDHDEGVADGEGTRGVVGLEEDHPKARRNQEEHGAGHAEEKEGALLGDKGNNPPEDTGAVRAGAERRPFDVIPCVDVDLLNPKVPLLGLEEHLGLDGEPVIRRFDHAQRLWREHAKAALGVRQQAVLRSGRGCIVKRTLANPTIQRHAGCLPPSYAKHDIGRAGQDGLDDSRDVLRVVLVISIKQHQGLGMSLSGEQPSGSDRRPLPEIPRMLDHVRPRERGDFRGVVPRPVVDHDDLFGVLLRAEDHGADGRPLVERGDRRQNAQRFALRRNLQATRRDVVSDAAKSLHIGRGTVSCMI